MPAFTQHHPIIDDVLGAWRETLGRDYDAYRGHVYRVFNYCRAIHAHRASEDAIAVAAAFHDLGIWSDGTFDYLTPSVARAREYVRTKATGVDAEQVAAMIELHHKLTCCTPESGPLAEAFRRADLVDVSLGLVRSGLARRFIKDVRAAFPNAGFHRALVRIGGAWFVRHPLRPLPMLRW